MALLPRQSSQAVEAAVALRACLPRHPSCSVAPSSAPSSRLSGRARRALHSSGTLRPHVSRLALQTSAPRRAHGAGPPSQTHRASWPPQRQPGLLQDGLSLGLLSRHHGTLGASVTAPSKAEGQHEHGSRRAGQPISPWKAWASRGTPFSRVTHLASGSHRSRRSWETCGAFGARRPLHKHAWFDDGRLSLLALLSSGSFDPFVDGVLVGGHARPYLRRGHRGVVVGVVVGLVQVPDGFFRKLAFQVIFRRRSRIGGVGRAGRAGGNLGPCAVIRGQVGILEALVVQVLIRGGRVVVLAGHVVIDPEAGVVLLPGPLAGVGH